PIEVTVDACLFDMDGTLVDSTPAVEGYLSKWARLQGVEPAAFFEVAHGRRARDHVKIFQTVPVLGSSLTEAELDDAAREIESSVLEEGRVLSEAGKDGITCLPGVGKLLSALKQGGARWGVVTSATNSYASSALSTAGIGSTPPAVPFLVTADLVTHGKPHPEPYLAGLAELNKLGGPPIDPKRVLVLEDAPPGLASGLAAGCQTLAVCTGQPRSKIRAAASTYRSVDFNR
ncbi:HAD-like domain-containing protein, partial [Leucosporidium creatinivorum]